ncbi:MAG: 2Fe-2S iron-sulfur cluster binding domain-containing protein, partial [Proteobacteria bacterium]|jgi:toluene monooxygenase electron transfer component|nr:2Fe-2S iron-sulfur cluster binding domain-containing protein [Pseudomonadota bacterium]MDB4827001.1 2Fe-2S iron-sulfur cluster binding domain-containing protein [Gammaproteobacteria bacterium]MBT4357432.1 2Fe-2S iron-sulfur cluster binding domain-containing protein [Pseudomonadota bacterium]MBT4986782.1 2Fe-2S iron-sulfur cluster binding domain-containing protein [Pseudomonadota bacterium]MBT5189438.1 2Fe-2S iron-sulfur cluster binding domain-containing protein [Pseudomonadota bacterium]
MTEVTFINKGGRLTVECKDGESLLQAGLRQGAPLPYACGAGVCATCVARAKPGTTRDLWPEAPAAGELKVDKGEVLLCQTSAAKDCEILVSSKIDLSSLSSLRPKRFKAKLIDICNETSDVATFRVQLPETVSPIAGQYFLLRSPDMQGFRAYSMTNYESSTDALDFVMKKVPGGIFSSHIFSEPSEDMNVEAFGPMGFATFSPSEARDLVCLVGGSGIAGIMSVLKQAEAVNHFKRHKLFMVFGARRIEDLFFLSELASLRATAPDNISIHIALSDQIDGHELPDIIHDLPAHQGFVHDVAQTVGGDEFMSGRLAFIGGPPQMLNSCIASLLSSGLPVSDIRYDRFA